MSTRNGTKSGGSAGENPRPLTPEQAAVLLGLVYKKPLTTEQVMHFRKPLPGYATFLGVCAKKLEEAGDSLKVAGVTPETLLEVQSKQEYLAAQELMLGSLRTSVSHQRRENDDDGMGKLQKLARRVEALAEDEPQLLVQWKFLLDYLDTFRATGPRAPKPKPEDKTAAEDSADEAPSDGSDTSTPAAQPPAAAAKAPAPKGARRTKRSGQ